MSEHSNNPKKFPVSTEQTAKMLGFYNDISEAEHKTTSGQEGLKETAEVDLGNNQNKGFAEVISGVNSDLSHTSEANHGGSELTVEQELAKAGIKSANTKPILKYLKTLLPYFVVFGAGLVAYFFYFSKVDFSKLFQRKPQTITQTISEKETLLSQLEKQDMEGYKSWVNQFYYEVTDQKVIDPDADNSGNGLSNFQKYLLKLNPRAYDTLSLGVADSELIAQGINPLTGAALTEEQKQIIDKYFDMEVIINRLTISKLHNSRFQNNGLNNNFNTTTPSQNNQPNYVAPDTGTSATFGAQNNGDLSVDPSVSGELTIASLGVTAPIIWTKDPKDFARDLQNGVIHYPGTAMPGQIGTTYISGHSSNVPWAKGSYNQIFASLGKLSNNASFQIKVKLTNGQMATLHYVVVSKKEYLPADQEQFKNTAKSTVALSTCWPIGSTAKRLVVVGELTQVEK